MATGSPTLPTTAAGERFVSGHGRWLLPAAVFVWPFVYFARRVWAFGGLYASIGNDFEGLYYNYKAYLLEHLSHGHIPLWSPAEAAGFPFYSNPFAQTFYPLNLPLAALYALDGGYSALDHQRFTVLGVSILALGLLAWLRSLRLPHRAALFATLVTAMSFKVAEILRFPNAVHTAAWYPWILWALTVIAHRPSARGKVTAGVFLCLFSVCFLTGGYPYYVYYGLFLFPPYLALLLVPALARRVTGAAPTRLGLSALVMLAAGGTALLLCGPYLFKMNALLTQTVDRGRGSLEYATARAFTPLDTLGSLVFPPAAQAEGWYYFGVSGLLLVLVFLAGPGPLAPRLALPAWAVLVSAVTWGKDSPLFSLLWTHMPFFSRLRVWGRLNIVLVPLLAWLLALSYTHFEKALAGSDARCRRRARAALAVGCGLVLATQAVLLLSRTYDPYWTQYFPQLAEEAPGFLWSSILAFTTLRVALALGPRHGFQRTAGPWLLTTALVGVAALDMGPVARRMWQGGDRSEPPRRRLELAQHTLASLSVPRTDHDNALPLGRRHSVGILPNWYFERYVRFLRLAESEREARRRLLGVAGARRLYYAERISYASVEAFLHDADRYGEVFDVLAYDGERLVLTVQATGQGYVSFIDNWDPDWQAAIDGGPAPIERLFGTFKAVRVPAGTHRVEFTYRPKLWPTARRGA